MTRCGAARARRGISQEALASEIGVHRTHIGGIECGERNVGLVNILRLAQALDVAPGQFFEPAAPPGSP